MRIISLKINSFFTDEFKQKFIETHINPNPNTPTGRKHIEAMSQSGLQSSNDFLKLAYFEVPPYKKEKRIEVAEGEFGIRVEKYLRCLKCQQVFPMIYTTVGKIQTHT